MSIAVTFYHRNFFSLYLSNYLNIILNKRRHDNNFQNGETAVSFKIGKLIVRHL